MTEKILEIIRAAGQIILQAHNINHSIENKQGNANFVTKYDYEVQAYLYKHLSELVPDAVFIGEEDDQPKLLSDKRCFIIDPIDGTTNFIYEYNHSAISVAMLEKGETVFGAVYNPYLEELFYAQKGKGSYLVSKSWQDNTVILKEKQLHMNNLSLKEGIAGFGSSPYYRELTEQSFELARKLYDKALDIRRSGSAALDICYVAAGRYVVFAELILSPWDFAAASLILKEAGGCISQLNKNALTYDKACSVICGTYTAYEEFFS